ncbi:MAG: DUF4276 family protein [Candidatus Parabeggiatoa sp.]|nr:DUF4276 family protein [Candidatus Parabeggiatoa sp.]
MIRLHFLVEGATERTFVNEVLKPELSRLNIFPDACCVQTGRKQGKIYKGGITSYLKLKNEVQRWLKQDKHQDARLTTMVDFYALPNDFPGYDDSRKQSNSQKRIELLEHHFQADIGDHRFIPYIQQHEFEALLFTEPTQFAVAYPQREAEIQELIAMRSEFKSPEDINENNAPSKRIQAIFPDYGKFKPTVGPPIALEIGLTKMRTENPHFDEWLKKLEQLAY